MSKKIKVDVQITEKVMHGAIVAMTRAEYDEWCERIDNARGGFAREEVAQELLDFAKIDVRHGNPSDMEVEEFCEVKPK